MSEWTGASRSSRPWPPSGLGPITATHRWRPTGRFGGAGSGGASPICRGRGAAGLARVRSSCPPSRPPAPSGADATGAVGVMESQDAPHWPTAQAVLARWHARQRLPFGLRFKPAIAAAINWILATKGTQIEPAPEIGHDSLIIGWPWVESTHSWLEPTSSVRAGPQHGRLRQPSPHARRPPTAGRSPPARRGAPTTATRSS